MVKVNFQAASAPSVPAGYVADYGDAFGDRGNGFAYGWNIDNAVNARYRDSANSPDLRYDTFVHMIKAMPPAIWNVAVPNGTYDVHIVSGDPQNVDSVFQFDVEGVLTDTITPNTPAAFSNN
jgi:hypothetical protein